MTRWNRMCTVPMEKQTLRIFICGPHSTGKTTLLNDLEPYLEGVKVIDEVARDIIRDHGWERSDFHPDTHPDVFQQLNKEILEKQIEVDLSNSHQAYICDRGIDPIIYATYYLGQEAKEEMYSVKAVDRWIDRMRQSLVFLISPHKECIHDDSVRLASSLEELQQFYRLFEEELNNNNIPFHPITVLDRQERVQQVVRVMEEFKQSLSKTKDDHSSQHQYLTGQTTAHAFL